MSSVAIVGGGGAIGGFFAAQLAGANHEDIVVCVRRPFRHLILESPLGNIKRLVAVLSAPSDARPVDWVLLATKTYQTAGTKAYLERLCGPHTRVAVLQNGVEHEERVAPLVKGAEVVPAVVYCDATAVAPGHIIHRGGNLLIVPDGVASRDLQALFSQTPAQIKLDTDFVTAAWTKLCLNVAINSITAITGQRGQVMQRSDIATLAMGLVAECIDVGRRVGAKFGGTRPEDVVNLSTLPADSGSSMLDDKLAGRPFEHAALNGAVVRIGARVGAATPVNAAVLALLAAISENQVGK